LSGNVLDGKSEIKSLVRREVLLDIVDDKDDSEIGVGL
jgi:hypothetical protein